MTTATSDLILAVIHFLLMTRENVREGEYDHRAPICKQYKLQFNIYYNPKEEILLTHTFNNDKAT